MRTQYPTFSSATPLLALALIVSGACMVGEQDLQDTDPDGTDIINNDDASGDEEEEAPGCALLETYATLSEAEAITETDDDGDIYYEYLGELAADPLNELEVSLWLGSGVFTEVPIGPGTYIITGEDKSYEDCGLCAVLFGDVDPITDEARQMLMAQSGTIQIDSIAGTMSGSLQDVVFKEVDEDTEIVIPGGCETTLTLPFSAPL